MADASFPLTVERAGGIAGFCDRLVIAADGLMWVKRKGMEPRRCRLTAETAQRVALAASLLPLSAGAGRDSRIDRSDDMVVMVTAPSGAAIRLPDRAAGVNVPSQVFHDLLGDLRLGAAGSRMSVPL